MKKEVRKQLKIFSILFTVFVMLVIIGTIFIIRMVSIDEKIDDKISAKEAYEYLLTIERYQDYTNNITRISASGGLSKEGKAEMWKFRFREEKNHTNRFFSVTIHKNLSYYPIDNPNYSTEDPYIQNWEIDSTEIMDIADSLECIKDFYKDHSLLGVGLVGMIFKASREDLSIGCIILISYGAGGGLFSDYHEMNVYLDGTTGELVDVIYND